MTHELGINANDDIYFEFPTDLNKGELLELLPPQIAEAITSAKITAAKVNLSNETKKIANWNCYSTEFEMVFMVPAINIMPEEEDLMGEKIADDAIMEPMDMVEGAIRGSASFGNQDMDMSFNLIH